LLVAIAPAAGVDLDTLFEAVAAVGTAHHAAAYNGVDVRWNVQPRGRAPAPTDDDGPAVLEGTTELLLATCTIQRPCTLDSASAGAAVQAMVKTASAVHDAAIWMTAPCPIPLEQFTPGALTMPCSTSTELEHVCSRFADLGMAVLPGCIQQEECTRLISMCCARIAAAEVALNANHPEIIVGETMFVFAEIGSRGSERFDLLLDPDEPGLVGVDAGWLPAVTAVMGCERADIKLQVSVVYSRPGSPNQDWHSDGGHLHPDAGWPEDGRTLSNPYAVCVFTPLIDLDQTVGFTQFCTVLLVRQRMRSMSLTLDSIAQH
jgi:hypothetical protein